VKLFLALVIETWNLTITELLRMPRVEIKTVGYEKVRCLPRVVT